MKRADKARCIAQILEELFPDPPVPLDHTDPYTLLVAVLLSAQCTDARVNMVTPALFAMAPTPVEMAKCSVEQILEKIRSCGLAPSKAKNIRSLSEILVQEYQGQVPRELAQLEKLPGVGHKTASVVVSQAFGVPAFPVDTHIHRLAYRWGLSDGSKVQKTEQDLKALFAPEQWNKIHIQIIYFGRAHCPARGHDWASCPICRWAAPKVRMREEQQRGATKAGEPIPEERLPPAHFQASC